MQTLYKLKDYKETFKFEREHPRSLRWDDRYKLFMLTQEEKCQGIWLKDKNQGLVGEVILSWQSDNILNGDSITVLPDFRRKGLATDLINLAMDWGQTMEFEWLVGKARKGNSWNVFENLGAVPLYEYKNWRGTGESYMFFKIKI